MIVAGADPGFSGAVCFVQLTDDTALTHVIGVVDMPTVRKSSGRRELLLHELISNCVQTLDGRRCGHIWIERVNAFAPGNDRMGASAAFAFGECYMALKMLAACKDWPFTLVSAAQWKKSFALGRDKAQARARASELLPEDARLWTPKRSHVTQEQANGRAEAALLAMYGARSSQPIAGVA